MNTFTSYSVVEHLKRQVLLHFDWRFRVGTSLPHDRTWQLDAIRSLISAIRTLEDVPRLQRERDEANSKIRELKKKIRLVEIENSDLRRRLMEVEARNG